MMSPCIETRRARPLLGTFVEIAARAPDETVLRRAIAVAFIAVAEVQRLMNRHDPASEVSRLNRDAVRRRVAVHRWTRTVLCAAQEFAEESGGAFDITVGSDGSWRDVVIEKDGGVHFRRAVTIDLGGIAKGFAVDRAVDALKKAGAGAGTVNAGGDLRVFGNDAQAVRIRHPLDPGRMAGTVLLRERALATSARYFAPALFDGRTRASIVDDISVTVGAPDCLTADALTKIALVLRGEAKSLLDRHGADAFLLGRNLQAHWLGRTDAP
jgi:thiamine biosynthesis lipoprotein